MAIDEVLGFIFNFWVGLAFLIFILLKKSMQFVPQNRAFIVERFGKYNQTMEAGLNFMIPFIDKVSYNRSLKEQAADVPSQGAITKDNISLIVITPMQLPNLHKRPCVQKLVKSTLIKHLKNVTA